jgi:hypothetical protein
MRESDGSGSHKHKTQELTPNESEDPAPQRMRFATDDVNGRRSIRA